MLNSKDASRRQNGIYKLIFFQLIELIATSTMYSSKPNTQKEDVLIFSDKNYEKGKFACDKTLFYILVLILSV